jgi:hypothetical protein
MFCNAISLRLIKSSDLVGNTILKTKFTKKSLILFTYTTYYYNYFFIKLIFKFILVMFKHSKSLIFSSKKIGKTTPYAIIYKTNVMLFFYI